MTTTPATLNFYIYAGATFSESITVRDSNGDEVDLTGYTARMQVRRDIADADPLLELTTSNGGVTLGGAAGTIDLLVSATATADLSIDTDGETWVHDILLTSGAGVVERTFQGCVFASAAVTR